MWIHENAKLSGVWDLASRWHIILWVSLISFYNDTGKNTEFMTNTFRLVEIRKKKGRKKEQIIISEITFLASGLILQYVLLVCVIYKLSISSHP